jgi:hypothetical protein
VGLHSQRAIALRGDPGLLGALGGAIKGVFTGGIPGAIAGAVSGFAGKQPTVSTLPGPGQIPRPGGAIGTTMPITRGPGVTGILQRALPFGATGYETVLGGPGMGAPSGYHLNKTGYYTASGYVPPKSKYVRNRSRNVSNGRANMRALRRLEAWDKADRKRRKALKAIARG